MNEYAGRPFQALAIDLWNGSEAAIDAFVNATGITYPILLKGGEAGVNIDYGCYADDFFVVGPEGEILYRNRGWSEVQVRNVVDEALADMVDNDTATWSDVKSLYR